MLYKIYAGLGGGFGGAQYQESLEFENEIEAEDYAYQSACEEYESYSGLHGLRSIEDITEEDEVSEDSAYEIWLDERETWLDYYVEET